MKPVNYSVLCLFLIGLLAGTVPAEERTAKEYRAVRTEQAPKMDGKLDDPCWAASPPETSFTQRYPDEGKPPSEKTEFRVLYDNASLYIAVRAFDSQPHRIVGRLTRRDEGSASDRIRIDLDPYLDRRSGASFEINPAGVKVDEVLFDDEDSDESWDGVWDGAAGRDSLGWCAEFRIPFSILRFKHEANLTFGFNVLRNIQRKVETNQWKLVPRNESGWISKAGNLTGLAGITRPKHLEFLPYAVTRIESKPKDPLTNPKGTTYGGRAGGDLKYGLASNLTLDATFNPDFGQVEADPQVLNLSAFETFYPEKRPFFLEGATLFETPGKLFYSRRIGKALYEGGTRFDVNYDTDVIKKFPDFAPILGAAKLTGKVGGTSLGLVDGVTGKAYAMVDSSGVERKRLVEPLTNYVVLRTKTELGASHLGFIGTAVSRDRSEPGATGAADWRFRFNQNIYSLSGQAGGSQAGRTGDRKSGWGSHVELDKEAGKHFRGTLSLSANSPELRLNDLGYLRRNDIQEGYLWLQLRKDDRPFGPFRSLTGNLTYSRASNFHQDDLSKGGSLFLNCGTRNWWYFGGTAGYGWQTYNDRATRGGPLVVNPANSWAYVWLNSDSRKAIVLNPNASVWRAGSGSRGDEVSLYAELKPASNLKLSFIPLYAWSKDNAQWVENVDDDGDGIYDHFVFGELKSRTLDLTARADITFTPNLSFQLYAQPYLAVGHYENTKELAQPKSYEFTPYDLGYSPDFNVKSLRGNAVLRWEYRPGSTIYLVWTQNRYEGIADPGDFSPRRDFRTLLNAQGENVFMMKVNYWFNL